MSTEYRTPEERAARRVDDWVGLMWHLATFLIINGFLWIIVPTAAVWVTLGWGIGVAFHVAAYLIGGAGTDNRRFGKYLEDERRHDAGTAA